MSKQSIFNSLALIAVGAAIGGALVYSYYSNAFESDIASNSDSLASAGLCDISQALADDEPSGESVSSDSQAAQAYLKFRNIKSSFIPSGVPGIYGKELDISFDEVQDAINKVQIFGPTYGQEGAKITLTGQDLNRYINIGSQTSCQYCCTAKTLVTEDGDAACGCAHSIMMRGLASYLIKNYPEMSDQEILQELNAWKITFFPKQTLSAYLQELEQSGEAGVSEILQEFPDFLPQMVGGC